MLEGFAMIIILLIVTALIWLVVAIGSLPGRIARRANHPQADAIVMLGWLGLLFGGVGWALAMVWARYKTPNMLQQPAALSAVGSVSSGGTTS